MAFYWGPKVVTDGLLLYYDTFNRNTYPNDVSDDFLKDLSGNNFHAAKSVNTEYTETGITFITGSTGGAIALVVDSDAADVLKMGLESRTIEVWIKIDSGTDETSFGIFNHSAQGGALGYGVQITNTYLRGEIYGTSGGRQAGYCGTDISFDFDVWNHCVFIFDRDNLIRIGYINGEYIGYSTFTEPDEVSYTNSNAHVGTSHSNYFRGLGGELKIIKIYNRVLTNEEIIQNYDATKTRFGI